MEDIGEENALALKGQPLDERHYTSVVDTDTIFLTPDRKILFILMKNRIPSDLIEAVRPIVRKAARQPVAGGNRVDAAGAGRAHRKRKDGTRSKMTGVPRLEDLSDEDYRRLRPAKGGTIGYNGRDVRGGQVYPCRLTAYSGALPSELRLMSELAKVVAESFRRSLVKHKWEAQFKKASQTSPDFLLKTPDGHLPFTTITANNTFRTAAHIDAGDLKQGFGVMCCFGKFGGCYLIFPQYKVAVRYCEGDILLADVANKVHGNSPLLNRDGTVPEPGEEPERLVCVFYYEEDMDQCMPSVEEEMEFINNRKKGDPIYPKKKRKKS